MPVEVRGASRPRAAPSRLVASLPAATSALPTPLALPIAAAMALLAPTLLWFVAPRRPNPAPPASR
jgi:hypothetical protein